MQKERRKITKVEKRHQESPIKDQNFTTFSVPEAAINEETVKQPWTLERWSFLHIAGLRDY